MSVPREMKSGRDTRDFQARRRRALLAKECRTLNATRTRNAQRGRSSADYFVAAPNVIQRRRAFSSRPPPRLRGKLAGRKYRQLEKSHANTNVAINVPPPSSSLLSFHVASLETNRYKRLNFTLACKGKRNKSAPCPLKARNVRNNLPAKFCDRGIIACSYRTRRVKGKRANFVERVSCRQSPFPTLSLAIRREADENSNGVYISFSSRSQMGVSRRDNFSLAETA